MPAGLLGAAEDALDVHLRAEPDGVRRRGQVLAGLVEGGQRGAGVGVDEPLGAVVPHRHPLARVADLVVGVATTPGGRWRRRWPAARCAGCCRGWRRGSAGRRGVAVRRRRSTAPPSPRSAACSARTGRPPWGSGSHPGPRGGSRRCPGPARRGASLISYRREDSRHPAGRRIDNPHDWVRQEIRVALTRGFVSSPSWSTVPQCYLSPTYRRTFPHLLAAMPYALTRRHSRRHRAIARHNRSHAHIGTRAPRAGLSPGRSGSTGGQGRLQHPSRASSHDRTDRRVVPPTGLSVESYCGSLFRVSYILLRGAWPDIGGQGPRSERIDCRHHTIGTHRRNATVDPQRGCRSARNDKRPPRAALIRIRQCNYRFPRQDALRLRTGPGALPGSQPGDRRGARGRAALHRRRRRPRSGLAGRIRRCGAALPAGDLLRWACRPALAPTSALDARRPARLARRRARPLRPRDRHAPSPRRRPAALRAALGIARSLLATVDGFRADLGVVGKRPGRGEESAFLELAIDRGATGVYVGAATAHHKVDESRLEPRYLFTYGVESGVAVARTRPAGDGKLFGRRPLPSPRPGPTGQGSRGPLSTVRHQRWHPGGRAPGTTRHAGHRCPTAMTDGPTRCAAS